MVGSIAEFAPFFTCAIAVFCFLFKRSAAQRGFFVLGGTFLLIGFVLEAVQDVYGLDLLPQRAVLGISSCMTFLIGLVSPDSDAESNASADDRIRKLERSHRKLSNAREAQAVFFADMSHEIRTPLTAICGFAENLQDESLSSTDRREMSETIMMSGEHLLQVVNDVLDLSKIEACRLQMDAVPCSPFAIVEGVCEAMRPSAAKQGLDLRVQYDSKLPERLLTDPTRVRQILWNLVSNAIKFTEEGQVVVKVSCECSNDELAQLDIAVEDSGCGMDEDQLERLFLAFEQAETSTSRRYGGSGLGLTISKRLAGLLGGDLSATSSVDCGSRFLVTLPVEVAEDVEWTDDPARFRDQLMETRTRHIQIDCDVLLADDNSINRKLVQGILERAGARVVAVEDGKQAIEQVLENEFTDFDVLLMDMQMPEMDGFEATERLRESGVEMPIFALTASNSEADFERCVVAGCDACLTKPIDRAKLLALIQALDSETNSASAFPDTVEENTREPAR